MGFYTSPRKWNLRYAEQETWAAVYLPINMFKKLLILSYWTLIYSNKLINEQFSEDFLLFSNKKACTDIHKPL